MIGRSTGRRRRDSPAEAAPFSGSRVVVPPSPFASLLPTFGLLRFAIALAWGLFVPRLFRGDGDVGRHSRISQDTLAGGRIPTADAAAGLAEVAVLSALLVATATWASYRVGALVGAGTLLASMAASLRFRSSRSSASNPAGRRCTGTRWPS
jgi:hypothetical protein